MNLKVTEKQKHFCEEYVKHTNATEAYMVAFNATSRASAGTEGCKLLKKPHVQAYIDELMAKIRSERIADATEVLEYLTRVIRGEETETTLKGVGGGAQRKTQIDVKASDKLKAAEMLGKVNGVFTEKLDITSNGAPVIVDNIPRRKGGRKK